MFNCFKRITRTSNWLFILKLFGMSILLFILFFWSRSNSRQTNFNCQWPPTDKVVVIAVTGPPYLTSWSTVKFSKLFHLYLPFCVAAWKRIGYSTLIVVVGESTSWHNKGHYLNYVYETLEKNFNFWVRFHFIQVQPTTWISYVKVAQVIRLFAADLEPLKNKPFIYLVTNDADTLPLNDIYSLPDNSYDIRLSIPFRRYFRILEQYRLSTIGMKVSLWQKLMDYESTRNISNFAERIETVAMNEKILAKNMIGFLDQNLASVRIHKWLKNHNESNMSVPDRLHEFDRGAFRKANSTTKPKDWFKLDEASLPKDDVYPAVVHVGQAITRGERFDIANYFQTYLKLYSQCENPNSETCSSSSTTLHS